MAVYRITREVESGAHFPVPFEVRGITLVTVGGRTSGAATATGAVEADNFRKAVEVFEQDLRNLLDALAITSLVGISSYGGSVFVSKDGDPYGLLQRWRSDREVLTLTSFDEDLAPHLETVLRRTASDDALFAAVRHYRESMLYRSTLVATLHLVRAAEALAAMEPTVAKCSTCGEDIVCARCETPASWPRTNRRRLIEIMGTPTHAFFYKKPGARNRLMHGAYVDQEDLAVQVQPLRAGVQSGLRLSLGLPEQAPLSRARGLWVYRRYPMWLRTESEWPSLQRLVEMAEAEELHGKSDPQSALAEAARLDADF
jgi:hypothetical protein